MAQAMMVAEIAFGVLLVLNAAVWAIIIMNACWDLWEALRGH